MVSRRTFGKVVLVASPLAAGLPPAGAQAPATPPAQPGFGGRGAPAPPPLTSNFGGVQIGVITYTFRQGVATADLIPVMRKIGISYVELMSNHAEALAGAPAPPAVGGRGRGRGPVTPEQQAAQQAAREELTKWRASVSTDTFKAVRKQFDDAGIDLRILCYNLSGNVTDEEIDYSFRIAQALGVSAISSSSTVTIAKRVAAFADKYKLLWGGHGHDNVNDPEQFATLESYAKIMSFSNYIGVNLDIGHFTAAGYDPISKEHHDRINNLHDTAPPWHSLDPFHAPAESLARSSLRNYAESVVRASRLYEARIFSQVTDVNPRKWGKSSEVLLASPPPRAHCRFQDYWRFGSVSVGGFNRI